MANSAILIGGHLKRITDFTLTGFNHKSGFLVRFTYKSISYIHVNNVDFRKEDINTSYATAGYYDEAKFLKYKSEIIPPTDISQMKLNLDKLPDGILNDTIFVRKLHVVAPYDKFCKIDEISWLYKGDSFFDIDSIVIPPASLLTVVIKDVDVDNIAREFYANNIKLVPSANIITNTEQASAAYIISMIALHISNIQKDIFSLFAEDEDLGIYIRSQNFEWGSADIFLNPSLTDLQSYLNDITAFYNTLYANQVFIKQVDPKARFYWLAYVLSTNGLAIISVPDKIRLLTLIAQGVILEQSRLYEELKIGFALIKPILPAISIPLPSLIDEEKFVLKIIASIHLTPGQIDDFLSQLISINFFGGKEQQTLFEILYDKLDDNRIGRYSSGLLNDSDNRKEYIQLLYQLWEISKYNPVYKSPSYFLPQNENGVYPESFFMVNYQEYYGSEKSPAILSYSNDTISSSSYLITTDGKYSYKIKSNTIEVKSVTTTTRIDTSGKDMIGGEGIPEEKDYGKYNIYQPISIIGYKPDQDITIPNKNVIPIFFLYFADDYQGTKKFDFGVVLLIDVALNFTGIGAIGDLRYLGYLKTISKFGRLATLSADELVIFWSAVKGVNATIQFSAGSALAISSYLSNTSTDADIIKFTKSLNVFLGLLTLASLSVDAIIKGKVIKAANNLSVDYENLLLQKKEIDLAPDVIKEIEIIGELDASISLMKTKIAALPLSGELTIGIKFESFTSQQQFDFFTHFYNLGSKNKIWILLNEKHVLKNGSTITLVDIWVEFRDVNKAKNISTLQSFLRFKYLKYNEFEHIWLLDDLKGGHTVMWVTDDLSDATKLWKIVPSNASININIPTKYLTKTYEINGHFYYENVWRFNSNIDPAKDAIASTINGLGVSRKPKHFVINPVWDEQRLLEEMSYANAYKVLDLKQTSDLVKTNPTSKIFNSTFSEGTKVEILFRQEMIKGVLVDQMVLLAIKKP